MTQLKLFYDKSDMNKSFLFGMLTGSVGTFVVLWTIGWILGL